MRKTCGLSGLVSHRRRECCILAPCVATCATCATRASCLTSLFPYTSITERHAAIVTAHTGSSDPIKYLNDSHFSHFCKMLHTTLLTPRRGMRLVLVWDWAVSWLVALGC